MECLGIVKDEDSRSEGMDGDGGVHDAAAWTLKREKEGLEEMSIFSCRRGAEM